MAISIGIVITGCASAVVSGYQAGDNQTKIYCQQQVSVENWEIRGKIVTSGVVSDETIDKVVSIIQNDVSQEAWNYLNNSGGKLVIVEGSNIRGYITENYAVDTSVLEDDAEIFGYCPKFINDVGDLEKVDVVVASECLGSLQHEFCHVLDYSHNYSNSKEFQKIYQRVESIGNMIFSTEGEVDYYSSNEAEFFAETAKRYVNGDIIGVDAELEAFMSEVTR